MKYALIAHTRSSDLSNRSRVTIEGTVMVSRTPEADGWRSSHAASKRSPAARCSSREASSPVDAMTSGLRIQNRSAVSRQDELEHGAVRV